VKLELRYPAGVENASDHAELALPAGREQFDHHKPAHCAAAESLPRGGGR
jgi:hypothetical protein